MSDEIKYGRKRSGIKKELNDKITEWLESIDDKELRETLAKEVIVTGGSIASMLLGEKINDFDIYFKTKGATRKVAEYYVAKFNKEHGTAYEVLEENLENCKGETEDRITIRIPSEGIVDASEVESEDSYRVTFMSQNAITLTDKMQLIIRFYGDPEKIHDNYDFVHAMCYWDHDSRELVLPSEALEALLSRTLIYRGSLYPIASIFRMKKFIERGWRIGAGQQLKIMWQISELNLSDINVMREQLTGVDMAYLHELIAALEKVDKDKINSTYVGAIIDRIFD